MNRRKRILIAGITAATVAAGPVALATWSPAGPDPGPQASSELQAQATPSEPPLAAPSTPSSTPPAAVPAKATPAKAKSRASVSSGNFPGFWPVTTWKEAQRLQDSYDQGHQPWRGDPADEATAFAQDFARWNIQVDDTQVGDSADGKRATVTFRVFAGEEGQLRPVARHTLSLFGLKGKANPVWFVSGLRSDQISVDSPRPGQVVSSPIRVAGRGQAYEGTLNPELRDDSGRRLHPRPADPGYLMAGATEMAPFEGALAFTRPTTAAGILVISGDTGAGPVANMTVVRVRFR